MDGIWLDLLERAARLIAVALAACGLFLVFLDMGTVADAGGARTRLAALWRGIAATKNTMLPGLVFAFAADAVDRFVVYWYEQSERNAATSGIFSVVVFVAIPLAALANWLGGGSPRLMIALAACVAGICFLAVASERRGWEGATSILAPVLFAAIFLVVPLYVFISLTDRTLNMSIAHASLASLLLAPLLYLVCHSAVLAGAAVAPAPVPSRLTGPLRRTATLFAAALPFGFVATFAALLADHLARPELPVPSTWATVIVSAGAASLSFAVTIFALESVPRGRPTARFGLALLAGAGLSIIVALGGAADADASARSALIALPLAVPSVLLAAGALAVGAKAVLGLVRILPGGESALERPYRVSGVFLLAFAVACGACLAIRAY